MERLFEGGPGEDKDGGPVGHQTEDPDDGAEDELQDVPVELAPLGNSLVPTHNPTPKPKVLYEQNQNVAQQGEICVTL